MWVTGLALFSSLLKMVVPGSSVGEWLGLLCFQACWRWLSLALQFVSDRACFVFKLAKNGCPRLSSGWVTGLALFSSLLKMVVLGSPGGEWLCLLSFKPAENDCPWLSSQWVTGLALFSSLLKWLSLPLQWVSGWACFVFKPAENGCPWLSGCEWLSLLFFFFCFQAKNGCPWLSSLWVTGFALFSSLLLTSFLAPPVGKWLTTSQYFKPANKLLPWLFRMWVASYLVNFILSTNAHLSLTLHCSYFPGLLECMFMLSFEACWYDHLLILC